MMWLLWLQFRQKALWLLWKTDRDIMRQSWCGRRSPNTNAEASSQTTLYSIPVVLTSTVCIPNTHTYTQGLLYVWLCVFSFVCCCCVDITVPANVTSYTLRSLAGNTKYDTWIVAATIKGSARGFNHSFTTQKYGEHRPPTPVASWHRQIEDEHTTTYLENQTSPL